MPLRPDSAGQPHPRRRTLVALVASALVAALLGPMAQPAAAADDDTVGIAAAPAKQGQPDGRSRFSLVVSAGQSVDDTLLVRNTGSTDQTFDLYATDAFNTDDGAFALLEGAATPSDAGTWVAFDGGSRESSLDLKAGAQAIVPFTVTVPADATPGDHAGGIVVSLKTTSGQTTVDRRLATRLYVRVQGTVTPTLVVRSVTASQPAGGNPFSAPTTITAVVENTGDVALTAQAQAYVHTWFGRSVGTPSTADVAELLPGATRTLTFDVGSVGRVGYLAPHVTLTPSADADAYAFTLPPVDGRGTAAAIPWLVVIVVLVAAGTWFLVVRRRRSSSGADEAPDEGSAKEPETAGKRR